MKIKKLSRFKKWLAIGSSTAVASSLLLMFAGLTISKANDVKQVNNIQNQALQNRSVQPRAGHAIQGDYLLDSNNAIKTLNKNGAPVSPLGYTAMRSDGIGIGPNGYLMLNRETSKFDYIGYDGKVIWSSDKPVSNNMTSEKADPGWPIYVDYDDDQNVFTTWSKGVWSSGSTYLQFMAIDANTGKVLYRWHPTNSAYDFSANSYQEVLITKMENTPDNLIGYTVIQGNIKKLNEVKYMTIYFGKNNKPSTPPNSTSFISTGIDDQDGSAWASIQLVSNDSGANDNGHILRAKAFYRNGDHYLFFIVRYANAWSSESSYMSYVVHKNGTQQAFKDIAGVTGALTGSDSKYGTQLGSSREGAIYNWGNGVDLQFYIAESNHQQYIWLLNYKWDSNTIDWHDRVRFNTAGTDTIDFDTYNYRFYKNSFYGFGNNWHSDTSHYDSVMILNLGSENSGYKNGDNFKATNDNIKTISFPQSLYGAEYKNKRIGIFPSYSSKNRPFVDVNLNLNGISESNSPFNNAILTITPDGNYAYNTSLTGSEIDISSNATLSSIVAHKSTTAGNIDALKANNFKLLRQVFTRFNESTDIKLNNYYDSWSHPEQQKLCAQGKIAFNITITKAYGTSNGNLTSSVSEQTYGPVILSGYVPIPNTLVIDQDKNTAGNQVNLANISLGSNKVNTILPSQINEDQLKTWMSSSDNWKQYLDQDTIPRGFSNTNIKNISIENKNDMNGTVTVKFNLNSSFKNSTYSTNHEEYQVNFTGFKIQNKNTVLKSETVDASTILQIYNTSPYQLSNNLGVLKTKISENADKIFKDLVNDSLSADNISISGTISFIDATTLQVGLTIPAYVDNVQTTKKFTITINNLTNKQTSIDNDVTVNGELANKGNKDPELENLLKQFIIDNTQYWAMNETKPSPTEQTVIINSAHAQLQLSDINLVITDTNTPGQVTATVKVKKYIQANGKYIDANKNNNSPLSKTVVFKGFNDKQTTAKTNTISADSTINSYTAYQISQDQVKEFIVAKQANLWNNLPESSFTKDKVVIVGDLTPSTESSNTKLVVKVKIPAYVSGSVVNTSASNCPEWTITITGFAKKDDTRVASSTIAATNELAKLWPSSNKLTTDAIKTWLTSNNKAKLKEVFSNLPDGVVTTDINLDSSFGTNGIQILNATSIKVKLTLNKAWKNNVIVPFETPVELTINTLVDATTNVKNPIAVDGDLAAKNVNDVDNAALLSWFKTNYQTKNLIINLDKFNNNSFSANNITKIEIIQGNKNPSQGTIDAKIYLNKIIQKGIEQNKEDSFNVKFTNFTPLHDLSWVSSISATGSNIASLNPYDLTSQTNHSKIKEFIISKQDEIFDHNSTFTAENLKGFSASVVNGTTISVSFQVAGIKDGIQNDTIDVSFNITNLTKLSETTIKGVDVSKLNSATAKQLAGFYIGDVKDGLHNDVFKEFMLDASNGVISSIPNGLSINDISDITWSKVSDTELSLTIKLGKWYDSNGLLQTSKKQFTSTTNFSGFKTDTTNLKNNNGLDATDLGLNTFAPYELDSKKTEIQQYIFANYKNIFNNYAEAKMTDASKITIVNVTPISSTEANIAITMPGYENGWANASMSHTIKITNLQNKDTVFKDTINISSDPTLSALGAEVVTIEQIKGYINKNQGIIFKDVNSTAPTGYALEMTKNNSDSATGKVVINVSIDKYVENGTLKTSPKKTGTINIVGFKNSSTNVKPQIQASGIAASGTLNATKAPYEVVNDKTSIQTFIITNQNNIFDNLPSSLNIDNTTIGDVTITGPTEITVRVTIPADTQGTTSNKEFNFKITGFTNKETSIIKKSIAAAEAKWDNISATNLTVRQVKTYIWNNKETFIKNPINSLAESNIEITKIDEDPSAGQAVFKLKINKYIGADGTEKTNPVLEKDITITGLLSSTTSLKVGEIDASSLNKKPYEISEDIIKNFIVAKQNELIQNPAKTLTVDDISNIQIISDGDTNATSVKVKFTIPANQDGSPIPDGKEFTLKLTNLINGQSTLASSSLNYTDSDFSDIFNGYSVYGCDWLEAKYTSSSTSKNPLDDMKNYLNKNAQKWFDNLPKNSQNPVINVEFGNKKTVNSIILVVKFNGYTGQGATIGEITQNITLTLKATPSFNEIIPPSDINGNAFNKWLLNSGQSWPTDKATVANKLEEFVKSVVANKNLTPGQNIPNIYHPINIKIDPDNIDFEKDGTISLSSGAITINPNTGTNKITSQELKLKNSDDNSSVSKKGNSPDWLWIVIISGAAALIILLLVLISVFARYNRKKDNVVDDDIIWY